MKLNKNKTISLLSALAVGVTLASTSTQAVQLRHATGYAPGSMGAESTTTYAEAMEEISGGDVSAKVYALSLLGWAEMSDGIRDGMADSGTLLFPYFPAQYPLNSMLAELSMVVQLGESIDSKLMGLAYAGALSEYLMLDCPECMQEFAQQGQVFTGAGATTPYYLLCNTPVTSLADVAGKRLRAGGAQWARWAEDLDASPVSIPQNEVYEAMSQGVLDCSMMSTPELTLINLMEVVTDITVNVPGGLFAGLAVNNINSDTWSSLTEKQRTHVMRGSALFAADISWSYMLSHEENMASVESDPEIQVHQPDQDLITATAEFTRRDAEQIASAYEEKYGVEDAARVVKEFSETLNRWLPLVKSVESSEELTELFWKEVWSKVDVNNHGA